MPFDPRTEKNIATLVPRVQEYARQFMTTALAEGYTVKIISGTRTYAEQDKLFHTRTASGRRVTNARGGQSNHNFGLAWDIGLFKGNTYLEESSKYITISRIGLDLGLEWGGNWAMFDTPHYQCDVGKSVASLHQIVMKHGSALNDNSRNEINNLVKPLGGTDPAPVPIVNDGAVVQIQYKGKPFDIKAFLINSSVWVDARDFCDYFGGSILAVSNDGTSISFVLNGENRIFVAMAQGGRAFVKFADLNSALGFSFVFDSKKALLKLS